MKPMKAKDVLRACVTWKRMVDNSGAIQSMAPCSRELYDVIVAWQESKVIASIEKEVFDDVEVET